MWKTLKTKTLNKTIFKEEVQEDGMFNELRKREFAMSRGERKRKEKAASKRRTEKKAQKRLEEKGY